MAVKHSQPHKGQRGYIIISLPKEIVKEKNVWTRKKRNYTGEIMKKEKIRI